MSRVIPSLVAVAMALGALPLLAQTKEPLTHERLWSFKRVGTPVASPDGRWVVVSVTEPAYA